MNRSLTRCLLLSLCVFLLSCTSVYRLLMPVSTDVACAKKNIPSSIATSWYEVSINIAGNHLSGLALIKKMPDSSQRVVFMNEAGATFFDFGFKRPDQFAVYAVIKKLNRKSVVNTLRKDFELMFGVPFAHGNIQSWKTQDELFFGVIQKKETAYFVTDKNCGSLRRLEWGTKQKRKVSIEIKGAGYPLPDIVNITHYNFPLQISLTRFQKNDSAQ